MSLELNRSTKIIHFIRFSIERENLVIVAYLYNIRDRCMVPVMFQISTPNQLEM